MAKQDSWPKNAALNFPRFFLRTNLRENRASSDGKKVTFEVPSFIKSSGSTLGKRLTTSKEPKTNIHESMCYEE